MSGIVPYKTIGLKRMFGNERKFTAWLNRNLSVLEEETGLIFSEIESITEARVGLYRCDNLAGDLAAIESQLGKLNTDHIGKILKYAVNQKTKYGILICEDASEEDTAVILWLNENTEGIGFFLLLAQALDVGGKHTVIFRRKTGPYIARRKTAVESENPIALLMERVGEKFKDKHPDVKLGRSSTYRQLRTGVRGFHFIWLLPTIGKTLHVGLISSSDSREVNEERYQKYLPYVEEFTEKTGVNVITTEEMGSVIWETARGLFSKVETGGMTHDKIIETAVELMEKWYAFFHPIIEEATF